MKVIGIINIIVFVVCVNIALHSIKCLLKSKKLLDKIFLGVLILLDLSNICVIISLYV